MVRILRRCAMAIVAGVALSAAVGCSDSPSPSPTPAPSATVTYKCAMDGCGKTKTAAPDATAPS